LLIMLSLEPFYLFIGLVGLCFHGMYFTVIHT
jgi:hypothetical protein